MMNEIPLEKVQIPVQYNWILKDKTHVFFRPLNRMKERNEERNFRAQAKTVVSPHLHSFSLRWSKNYLNVVKSTVADHAACFSRENAMRIGVNAMISCCRS